MRFGVQILLWMCGVLAFAGAAHGKLRVPAGIDVAPWEELLRRYVDERGLVAYAAWKASPQDVQRLDMFLSEFARTGGTGAQGAEEIAALINAYNVFTIRWILQNYPTDSIRELDNSWNKARWNVGGQVVSLDAIEHENLRPLFGWRVHATIVCAARSCPPLQRHAYTADNLVRQTEKAFRTWLGRDDLNQFDSVARVARVSPIFKWFKSDFVERGALSNVLERFGPSRYQELFAGQSYSVEYRDYDWGLNDQGDRGRNYRRGFFGRLF